MSDSKISILGLYRWDSDLFKYLSLPDGIDKDTLVNNILLKSAEFECLYSDSDFMKDAIALFSTKWQNTFKRWIDAITTEYNPLENYDRIEEWEESNTNKLNGKSVESSNDNGTNTTNKSAFDTSTLQPYGQNVINNYGSNSSSTENVVQNDNKRAGRAHGNIGVTTSQQMLREELDVALWNIYEHITDIFLQEFCIMVY